MELFPHTYSLSLPLELSQITDIPTSTTMDVTKKSSCYGTFAIQLCDHTHLQALRLSNTLTSQQVFHTQIGNHHIAAFLITYVKYFSYFHLPTSVSALQCFHFSHYKNGTNNSCYICVHTVIGLSLMKLLSLYMLHRVMQKNWELIKEYSSQSKTRSVCILILNYSLTFDFY